MEKHLDLMIDFETCGLSANAAPMSVACVPWLRDGEDSPFFNMNEVEPFEAKIDLRSCVVGGYEFDAETICWWSRRDERAQEALIEGYAEPVRDVVLNFLKWLHSTMQEAGADTVCLWCQGMDVDIAMLRNICKKNGLDLELAIPHAYFRDCRTLILECALRRVPDNDTTEIAEIMRNPKKAYSIYAPMPEEIEKSFVAHDAKYDCLRSIWYTWQALRLGS